MSVEPLFEKLIAKVSLPFGDTRSCIETSTSLGFDLDALAITDSTEI